MKRLDYYYEQFQSWANEFQSASMEQQKMIICQLISRIEFKRGYELNIRFNMNYEQFFMVWVMLGYCKRAHIHIWKFFWSTAERESIRKSQPLECAPRFSCPYGLSRKVRWGAIQNIFWNIRLLRIWRWNDLGTMMLLYGTGGEPGSGGIPMSLIRNRAPVDFL